MLNQLANDSAQHHTEAGLGSDFKFNLQNHAEDPPAGGAPPAATPPAAADPNATPPAGTPPADGTPPAGTPPADGTPPGTDPPPVVGAPEKYEFNVPEGFNLNEQAADKVSAIFKKHNLSNEAANEMAAAHVEMMQVAQTQQLEAWNTQRDQWVAQVQKDPVLGGDNHAEAMAIAKRGLDAYGDPELNQMLVEYGLGDHPAIIRAFHKAGLTVKNDTLLDGKGGGGGNDNLGNLFFPNSKK